MCLTEQTDSSVQLPASDATRERRDPLTLGLLPEDERRVCEAVGPGPPALAGGPPLFARGLRHIAVSLIGVERIGLETDLVRRPRVRGTAPLATVGKERRLSS